MRLMGGIGIRAEGPCAQAIRAQWEKKGKEDYEMMPILSALALPPLAFGGILINPRLKAGFLILIQFRTLGLTFHGGRGVKGCDRAHPPLLAHL
jgi:hypothetical protein